VRPYFALAVLPAAAAAGALAALQLAAAIAGRGRGPGLPAPALRLLALVALALMIGVESVHVTPAGLDIPAAAALGTALLAIASRTVARGRAIPAVWRRGGVIAPVAFLALQAFAIEAVRAADDPVYLGLGRAGPTGFYGNLVIPLVVPLVVAAGAGIEGRDLERVGVLASAPGDLALAAPALTVAAVLVVESALLRNPSDACRAAIEDLFVEPLLGLPAAVLVTGAIVHLARLARARAAVVE
jgi:hypothetical protein